MLIAIVVVCALFVYAWVMGYIGVSTEGAGEAISIPSVANNPAATDLLVYVQNIGEDTAQLDETSCLYINGELVPCTITGVTVAEGVATLNREETAVLTYVGGAALPDEKVDIKVTTVNGKSAEYSGYPSEKAYNPPTLNYFTFDIIDNPQTAGVPFTVTISALDQYNDLFTGYGGVNNLTYSGGDITPSTTTEFVDGVWTGKVTVTGAATDATIVTSAQSNPSKTGTSNTFNVVYVPVAPSILWNKTYGGPDTEIAHSVVNTSDGGYAIAGTTSSYSPEPKGSSYAWLVKTDAFGVMEWNKTYGGPLDHVMEWNQTYGEQGDNLWFQRWEWAYSLVETSDGGYAIAGTKSLAPVWYDFWLIKTDGLGNEQWNRTYSIGDANEDPLLVATPDGGYVIAGKTDSDICLLKTDASGNTEWSMTCGGIEPDTAYSLIVTSDGGYAIAGSTESYGAGGVDFWLIKTD